MIRSLSVTILGVALLACGADATSGGPFDGSGAPGGPSSGASHGSPSGATTTTTSHFPVPAVDPAVDKAAVASATHDENAELDRLVGRYARGEAPIYRGSVSSHDNAGVLGRAFDRDGSLVGSVTASLTPSVAPSDAGWTLLFFGSDGSRVEVVQPTATPHVSQLSLVGGPSEQIGGVFGACTGCFVDLSTMPATIDETSLTARGVYGDDTTPLVVTMSNVKLARVAAVTFDDIVAVTDPIYDDLDTMRTFVPRGSEMVRTVKSSHADAVPPGKNFYFCERTTNYEVDWYVNRADPKQLGLRHFKVTSVETCCSDRPDEDDQGPQPKWTCQ